MKGQPRRPAEQLTSEIVEYGGRRYYRYPQSPWPGNRVYFKHCGSRRRGLLHRHMWEDAFGPIPDGMEVHHKDGNPDRNELDNFELRPKPEHVGEHHKGRKRPPRSPEWCEKLRQAGLKRKIERDERGRIVKA